MKFLMFFLAAMPLAMRAQNVGIAITSPIAGLHIVSNNGIISRGTLNQGAILNETVPGSLVIFNPNKGGAIRAGYLSQAGVANWDNASTGHFSIGLGYDAKATGDGSIAIGQLTAATGTNAAAIGYGCGAEMPNTLTMQFVQRVTYSPGI